jgi:alkylation response protein AidB-like acyl-CoA dehydrogenase
MSACPGEFVDNVGDLASAASLVGPLLAANSEQVERDRRIAASSLVALGSAGFPRHFVPARWGGSAGSFTTLVAAVTTIAEACAASAWCASLFAAHGRLAAYLPLAAQREIWLDGPDVFIAAAVVPPAGCAVRVGAGWRLTGEWAYASGIDVADWLLVASLTGLGTNPDYRVFAVPSSDCTVKDTWRNLGMRGTGSHTVVLDGVEVHDDHTFLREALLRPAASIEAGPVARCHSVPYAMVAGLIFAAPILGAARAMVRDVACEPVRAAGAGALARASAQVHAAELLLVHAAGRADASGTTAIASAENQRDTAVAVELCQSAADLLFRAAGSRAHDESDLLQRRWRDIQSAGAHGALRFGAAADAYIAALSDGSSQNTPLEPV